MAPPTTVLVSEDPQVWRMLAAVWLGEAVEFLYLADATPGARRRMTPIRVFRVEASPAVYAEGVWKLRGDRRVFRLDRIAWTAAPQGTDSERTPDAGMQTLG